MKVPIFNINGEKKGEVELPKIFNVEYRPDVIKKAFLVLMSKLRQRYGSDPMAGKKTSAHYHGKRDYRYTMMNREMSRLPRIHGSGYLSWTARIAPQAVKGRRAHPPKAEKNWAMKINKKENRLAIKSAIAATANKELIKEHGYKTFDGEIPIIIDDKFEELKKTKDVYEALKKLGLEKELERAKKKKVRAGKGKMRGRRYKRKVGPLIVVSKPCNLLLAARNIPGLSVVPVKDLNVLFLAPGGTAGRLTIFTESAIKELEKSKWNQ